MSHPTELPWYRQISKAQWKAFLATFFGWLLDGFDFTIMTFILIDIQNSFSVDRALAGAPGRRGAGDGDVVVPARWWSWRWYGRRPMGPQAAIDALDFVVLDLCVLERVLDVLRDALCVQGALRDRDGWRVGGGHAVGARALAGTLPWSGVGSPPGRLVLGIHRVSADVSLCLSAVQPVSGSVQRVVCVDDRLACDVLDRRHPSVACVLDPLRCQRESGLARTAETVARTWRSRGRRPCVACASVPTGPPRCHDSKHRC